jgi:RHS repeat-associated protein
VRESKGDGTITSYYNPKGASPIDNNLGLDPSGNIAREVVQSSTGTTTRDYSYSGNQLQKVTTTVGSGSPSDQLYWYTDDGDLWCVTTTAGSRANCPISINVTPPASVRQAYTYDPYFRLDSYRAFNSGTLTDCTHYKYDPLDRLIWEGESHGNPANCNDPKTTTFDYFGVTNQMTEEKQSTSGGLQTTKDYTYDIYGHRMSETVTPVNQAGTTYTYAYNVHDSVSLLLDPNGGTKASYGYRPYGDADNALTGGDQNKTDPFNPYRYEAKRFDSGSQTIDTGARRFSTDTSKFLQPDQFNGALGNLGLSTDPLSQNRYSLAGGNPLSFIEWDGHLSLVDGGGYADPSPDPNPDESRIARPGTASPAAAASGGTCTVQQLNCTYQDFENMNVDQRIQWIDSFQARYGRQGNFQDWFNAIRAVLRVAKENDLIQDANWFSQVDASILQAIQDGYALHTGQITRSTNPAAAQWQGFFSARAANANDDTSKRLWGSAEQTATNWGIALAAASGAPTPVGGKTFVQLGNIFRGGVRDPEASRQQGRGVGEKAGSAACDDSIIRSLCGSVGGAIGSGAADYAFDPRNEEAVYLMTQGAWFYSESKELLDKAFPKWTLW